jgi:NAD-dependent DNA ligase
MRWNPVKRVSTASVVEPKVLPAAAGVKTPASQESRSVVFTGGRDKVLEGMLGQYGWTVDPAITKKTTVLVVADDSAGGESGKVKKAKASGIRILTMSEFRAEFRS